MAMILLAESGATKTEWRLIHQAQLQASWQSEGLNPHTFSAEELTRRLSQALGQLPEPSRVSRLYFYGAGLRAEAPRRALQGQLVPLLPHASLHLADDLIAAVHAHACPEGIALILGTGSNAGRFAAGKVLARLGGLGYLLGDEGGGADLGRALLRGLLLPGWRKELKEQLCHALGQAPAQLTSWLYQAPQPALRLASLTHLIAAHQDEPEIAALLTERFGALLDTAVKPLLGGQHLPLTATGSVAFHFRPHLEIAVKQRGLTLLSVEPVPITALVKRFTASG